MIARADQERLHDLQVGGLRRLQPLREFRGLKARERHALPREARGKPCRHQNILIDQNIHFALQTGRIVAVTPPHRITIKYLITLFTTYGSIFEKTAALDASGRRQRCYLQNSDAPCVHLPKPLSTILPITRQTYCLCAASLSGPALYRATARVHDPSRRLNSQRNFAA